ncbi:MAG: Crp/Fnr family transcriptional regulator [Bacteroidetes bacterium]|nr:MAG: Crp/Fnr family transcriptional regulator [Bacteroidota bacterium]
MEQSLFAFIEQYMPLTQEEKDMLVGFNLFRQVKKGTILLVEGEVPKESFFVLQGCLRAYVIKDGEERTTAFFTEMQGVNPPGVQNGRASDYTVAAVEDSILSVATPEMEKESFEKFPRFEHLCRIMSERLLDEKQQEFDSFKLNSPEERYQILLQSNPRLVTRVPQHQLASFLGITAQSLSRIKSRMQEKERAALSK